MPNPTVTLNRCADYSEGEIAKAISTQFEVLGGVGTFVRAGDSVLLKPNLIAPKSERYATQTHPAVIIAVARLLKDFGARPFVGDSPAWSNVFACVKALKLEEPLRKLSVPVKQLDNPRWTRVGKSNTKVGISSVALDADVIINMPKFKTHQQMVATFAVKNMFGCVAGKRKALWHFTKGKRERVFCELLIDIFEYLKPAVTIIDGVVAMDGAGPIGGRSRTLGWIIGGTDPMSLETICCKLVNIKPDELPILTTARQMGLPCPDEDNIKILGDDFPESICMDFELPELIPLRFSLLHVFKSIGKQIILLAKAAIMRINRKEKS
jgi:uncharacterized protein (DUF362 family)